MGYEKKSNADILILGAGLTGIRAAAEAARLGAKVEVWSKGPCASVEIMGFNAVVEPQDSVDIFYEDLLKSGSQVGQKELARTLAGHTAEAAEDIEELGLEFHTNPDGTRNKVQTLGCSFPRLIHVNSYTGLYAMKAYKQECQKYGVVFRQETEAIELLKEGDQVVGALGIALKEKKLLCCKAKAVVLTTGGCGQNYPVTTYPRGIHGDGYAMAYRAGADLIDMEFMQYEPCCFIYPEKLKGNVAVTTLLLEGGKLLNKDGKEFVPGKYRMQKSELAFYVGKEIMEGRGTLHSGVYYDVTGIPKKRIVVDHAMYYRPALNSGVDLTKEWAEVAPIAHTCIGGVAINERCETSLKGLFAAGEAAGGVHGANRIGGCSGSETLVFGKIAGQSAAVFARHQKSVEQDTVFETGELSGTGFEEEVLQDLYVEMQSEVGTGLGIVKEEKSLKALIVFLEEKEAELEKLQPATVEQLEKLMQCKNMVLVTLMQARASLMRKESRGVFFRADFPQEKQEWKCNIKIRKGSEQMLLEKTEQ